MAKKIKYIFLLSILFTIGICTHSFARIKTNDITVDSGATVTITVSSQEPVASGAINITSNGGLTFKSASGGTVNGTLVAFSASNNKTSGIATYTFTAPIVTETKVYKVVFISQDMADEEGNAVASSSATATVTVRAPSTQTPNTTTPGDTKQSSDATLKSITVGDKKFSGSSLNNTITHTVANSVSSIKISAVKNDSKATVSGTGTKSLVEGQTNKFSITVTAENGTKKTYNVNIIRLAKESTIPNVIDETVVPTSEEEKLLLSELVIKDVELDPEFSPETYKYTANVQNMKELEIDAIATNSEATINIEGATDLQEGNNTVKITVALGDKVIEYVIDVYNTVEEEIVGSVENTDNDKNFLDTIRDSKKIILIVITCLLGLISIIYMIISYKLRKEIEGPEEDDKDNNFMLSNDEDEETDIFEDIAIKTGKIGRHF